MFGGESVFKKTICLLLTLLASGCASTPSYDEQLGSWVGRSQGELFADWGAPSEVLTEESGATVLYYHRERSWRKKGTSMSMGGSFPGGTEPIGASGSGTTSLPY